MPIKPGHFHNLPMVGSEVTTEVLNNLFPVFLAYFHCKSELVIVKFFESVVEADDVMTMVVVVFEKQFLDDFYLL
jgi:hypothetical protein